MTHKAIYMKRIILGSSLPFCALFTAPAMHAQESVEVLIRENGTERQESIELPKSMTYPLDSLLNDWKAKNSLEQEAIVPRIRPVEVASRSLSLELQPRSFGVYRLRISTQSK